MSTGCRRKWILATMAIFVAVLAHGCSHPERAQPDIVILLADDLGWHDVGYHNGPVNTPNIDRLARDGVRMDTFYAMPFCTPSRAALMTGRYPMRMGLQQDVLRPWSTRGLPLAERTLPEALRAAGYQTEMIGKWHLGHHAPEFLPMQRGFDHHYGSYCGLIDYFTHERLGGLDWHRDGKALREVGHTTDLIAAEAVRVLERRSRDKPLFLYVAFNAPHAPNQPPAECAGVYPDIESKERRAYLAQVTCMDRAIGRILTAVDARNTLVVFMSDNGGDLNYGADNTPLRGEKSTLYEGGVRVCALARWTGHLAPAVVDEPMHIVDWYPTLLKLSGGASSQPLPVDGIDLWPMIAGGQPTARSEILLNVEPEGGALLEGQWKLVLKGHLPGAGSGAPVVERAELFDLRQDIREDHDQSALQPERVREMIERLSAYASQAVPSEGGALDARPEGYHPPKVWGE